MTDLALGALKFSADGLVAVVAQHVDSGQVLMVAYATREALEKTIETRTGWFFSRGRGRLWQKGETSGNVLRVEAVRVDCDGDAVIYLCRPEGPTCHTGAVSCFFNTLGGLPAGETDGEAAGSLWATIEQRAAAADAGSSYIAWLLAKGVDRIGKKIGEEATEVVIAAKNGDRAELAHEVADLWFHTLVLLKQQGMAPADVWAELRSRRRD